MNYIYAQLFIAYCNARNEQADWEIAKNTLCGLIEAKIIVDPTNKKINAAKHLVDMMYYTPSCKYVYRELRQYVLTGSCSDELLALLSGRITIPNILDYVELTALGPIDRDYLAISLTTLINRIPQ